MSEKVSLYNPRDTPPEQLEAMLTGREPLLKEILDSLREQAGAETRQHWLLRGPRGIGKTHLTGIIHHRVSTDAELSRVYLPLWLGEADVYEVYSPATLLERIAERLVEAVPGAEIAKALSTLEGTGDEDSLFEEVAALLTEESERQGRILLVLMENLDALFESFAPKQRTAQTRQLRSLMLANPRLLFISTTPTRYLKELSDPKAPLFAQLKERRLAPLQVEEVGSLFTKLAQITGRKELLEDGPDAALKQRIIHQLTGGLPRAVVMAFEVLRDKEGIQPLVEDLRVFLDAQTAYFEARLSKLAPRERAIVTTLALAEQNLTLKETAEKSRLPEKSLSTLMDRLEQEGHVEITGGSGGKGTLYGLSEGLFRLWYQYRKGRLLLEPLVRFLAFWFEPKELQDVVDAMKQRLTQKGSNVSHTARLALLQVEEAIRIATSEQGRLERQRIWEECRRAMAEATPATEMAPALGKALAEVLTLLKAEKLDESRAALDKALAPYEPLPESLLFEAMEFIFSRTIQFNGEKFTGDPNALRLLLGRFSNNASARVQASLGFIRILLVDLLQHLKKPHEALSYLEPLLTPPQNHTWKPEFQAAIYLSHGSVLFDMSKFEETITSCRKLIDTFSQDPSLEVQDTIYRALFLLLSAHENLGHIAEYTEVLRQLAHKKPNKETPRFKAMRETVEIKLLLERYENSQEHSEVLREIDEWCARNQSLEALHESGFYERIKFIRDLIHDQVTQEPITIERVMRLLTTGAEHNPAMLAARILEDPTKFYAAFPASELRKLMNRLIEAAISAEQKEQLRFHLRFLDLLEAASSRGPEAEARIRQALGRIPVEMRKLFETLISRLR